MKSFKQFEARKPYPVMNASQRVKIIKIAKKHSGDMERAIKEIDRIRKNLSDNPDVMDILRQANEDVNEDCGVCGKQPCECDKEYTEEITERKGNRVIYNKDGYIVQQKTDAGIGDMFETNFKSKKLVIGWSDKPGGNRKTALKLTSKDKFKWKWAEGTKKYGGQAQGMLPSQTPEQLVKWLKKERITEDVNEGFPPKKSKAFMKGLTKTFRKNEDENRHSENYLLLAKAFGSKAEIKKVEDIIKKNKKQGHTTPADNKWMYDKLGMHFKKIGESVEISEKSSKDLGIETAIRKELKGREKKPLSSEQWSKILFGAHRKLGLIPANKLEPFLKRMGVKIKESVEESRVSKASVEFKLGRKAAKSGKKYSDNPYKNTGKNDKEGIKRLNWSSGHNSFREEVEEELNEDWKASIFKALTNLSKKPEYKKVKNVLVNLSKPSPMAKDKQIAKGLKSRLTQIATKVDRKAGKKLLKIADLAGTYESVTGGKTSGIDVHLAESVSVDMRSRGFKSAMKRAESRKIAFAKKNMSETDKVIAAANKVLMGEDMYAAGSDATGQIAGKDMPLGKVKKRNRKGFRESFYTEEAKFSNNQISALKKEYGKLTKIDPASPTYKKFRATINDMSDTQLKQLIKANIKFISMLATNTLKRR